MTTWTITFADTFINELLNIPKSISKKVTKKIKILEQDPISAQGDAKKLKGYGNNIYRVRLGDYRLFYSFGSGWVKLLSVRKRDDRTYELEIPEFTTPNPVPEISRSDLQPIPSSVEQKEREKTILSQKQELPEDNKSKSTTKSDLPFKFTSSLLQQWQIPQEYRQKILKVKHSDDILDLPIPDRLISRILDNCFPRDLAEIERSPEYKLTKPEDLERFVEGEIEAFLLKLDPEQEKLIDFGNNNGAILVKGGAGTGKSTLALYRVKRLLELGYTSILFTTYTKALVNYSEQLLEQLLGKTPSQLGVKVATVDSLTYQYYKDLIQQGESAIAATSTLIGQGMVTLDCSEVEFLTEEQIAQLFSCIPDTWDFVELAEVFDIDTFSTAVAEQFSKLLDRRHGRSDHKPKLSPVKKTENKALDIFKLRDEVIGDYRNYIESFLEIRDRRVDEFVKQELDRGHLWRDPLIQINPAYKKGADIDALIHDGTLHSECKKYFPDFHFYYHQEQAFRCAVKDEPYVVTTGTGSGKSFSYVVPIINDLVQNPQLKGIRAILVYPMNALINSQEEAIFDRLEEFKKISGKDSQIRVARYTGQESLSQKSDIQNNPPQILLTNYVMLELMLSRVHEEKFIKSPILKYLVLDELHTYRGRQGADVALVIRKLRQISHNAKQGNNIPLLCIGTSATMSTEGDRVSRKTTVAEVASKLFGVEVKPSNIIDETLEQAIKRANSTVAELTEALKNGLPTEKQQTPEAFLNHPLSKWIEMNLGLDEETSPPTPLLKGEGSNLVRKTPIPLSVGSQELAKFTGVDAQVCSDTLKQMFFWSSRIEKGLPFRLHQFISQGGSVYATLESQEKRYLTLEGQYKTTGDRLLFPLVFCRECGQDYNLIIQN